MTHHTTAHVLAEVAVEPATEGARHGALVQQAIEALGGPELAVKTGPLSTTVEGDIDDVLHAVGRAHRAAAGGAERVVTTVRLESKQSGLGLGEREGKTPG